MKFHWGRGRVRNRGHHGSEQADRDNPGKGAVRKRTQLEDEGRKEFRGAFGENDSEQTFCYWSGSVPPCSIGFSVWVIAL